MQRLWQNQLAAGQQRQQWLGFEGHMRAACWQEFLACSGSSRFGFVTKCHWHSVSITHECFHTVIYEASGMMLQALDGIANPV
jgi:hypothetical protein